MLPDIQSYTIDTPLPTKAARNFALHELIISDTALRLGISNHFRCNRHVHNAVFLAREVLQPVRDRFGPYRPNSVFRCQQLERALKHKPDDWVSTSQHTEAEAADIEVPGVHNMRLAEWIRDNLEFDQLILECHNPKLGPNSGWVHVSRRMHGENRGEVLSMVMAHGAYRYFDGLILDVER